MVEASLAIEAEAIGTGGRNSAIDDRKCRFGAPHDIGIGDADLLRAAVRPRSDRPRLPHVDQAVRDAV